MSSCGDASAVSAPPHEDDDEEGEELDPRVQEELEKLNTCTEEINQLEVDLEDANCLFQTLLSDSTHQLNSLAKKLGSCIEKVRMSVMETQGSRFKPMHSYSSVLVSTSRSGRFVYSSRVRAWAWGFRDRQITISTFSILRKHPCIVPTISLNILLKTSIFSIPPK